MMRDVAVSSEHFDCEELLFHWRWLIPRRDTPLFVGVFGDWIMGAPDGSLWHASALEPSYQRIARNGAEYNLLNKDPDKLDEWFQATWASMAHERGHVAKLDECLGWKIAPIFGGAFAIDNIQVFSMPVYQAITGQIFRQAAGVAESYEAP